MEELSRWGWPPLDSDGTMLKLQADVVVLSGPIAAFLALFSQGSPIFM